MSGPPGSRPGDIPVQLLLASASAGRLATLRRAGFDPQVVVSGVDEDAELTRARERFGPLEPSDIALMLARAKAEDVASRPECGSHGDTLVLGCDSVLELDGEALGKPVDAEQARARWRAQRGRSGVLHTGHWLVDLREPPSGSGATIGAVASTAVHFADLSDAEVEAYVATGEPLGVAGAFTIDGLGGPFVTGVEGDPHNVVGLSLPVLRDLLGQVGLLVHHLWVPQVNVG